LDNDRPLFQQIKEAVEEDILSGALQPDEQIPSNSQLVNFYQINPVTVHKGISQLVDEGTVYKKRGLGMFVSPDAPARLRQQRQGGYQQEYVQPAIRQAKVLGIKRQELHGMIDENWGSNDEN
jgi:DNA-binding transcriptional regulator YhcF (GntR family)